jgi:hypothetical protein
MSGATIRAFGATICAETRVLAAGLMPLERGREISETQRQTAF